MTTTITPKEAYDLLQTGAAVLIDVREPDEFHAEHIPYALSVPLSSFDGSFNHLNIPQDRKILFQCLKGTRGADACARAQQLEDCGNEVLNVEAGIEGWKNADLPVIGAPQPHMTIVRQVQLIIGSIILISILAGFAGLKFGFILAGLFGSALAFAGLTGWCGLGMLLAKMPWNK